MLDLVPSGASPSVVVVARPDELLAEAASRQVLMAIASDEDFERYRQHTGIDPRLLDELVWASTDEGSVLIARGPFSAPLAVAEMAHRMLPLESRADEPFVRRVGYYQGARRDLAAVSDHVLVAVTGSPALAEDVLERALGAGAGREAALGASTGQGEAVAASTSQGGAVASMLAPHRAAPLLVIAPRPLGLPLDTPVGLLLAREQALVATVFPDEHGISAVIELRGEFPPGAEANFRALVESLAASDLGTAIGMAAALPTLVVDAAADRVVLRATFPASVVAEGLRLLFEAEIAEIVDAPSAAIPSAPKRALGSAGTSF